MTEVLTAIYQNGAFVPEQPTKVLAGARVQLVIQPMPATAGGQTIEEFDAICDELSVDSGGQRMTRDQLHERD